MVRRLSRLAPVAAAGLTLAAILGLALPVKLAAAEPSWEGKTVLLTRTGVAVGAARRPRLRARLPPAGPNTEGR